MLPSQILNGICECCDTDNRQYTKGDIIVIKDSKLASHYCSAVSGGLHKQPNVNLAATIRYAKAYKGIVPFSPLAENETYRWQTGFPFSLHLFGCRRSSLKMGKMPVIFHPQVSYVPIKGPAGR